MSNTKAFRGSKKEKRKDKQRFRRAFHLQPAYYQPSLQSWCLPSGELGNDWERLLWWWSHQQLACLSVHLYLYTGDHMTLYLGFLISISLVFNKQASPCFRWGANANSHAFPDIYLVFLTCQSQNCRSNKIAVNFRDITICWKLPKVQTVITQHSVNWGMFRNVCDFLQNVKLLTKANLTL